MNEKTITVSTETYMALRALALGFDLLDEQGEPDAGKLLEALASGKIIIRLPPDPPIGTPRWVGFGR